MKRFLKYLIFLVATASLFFSLNLSANAFEENIDSYNEEFDFQRIADAIDAETAELLAEMGIDEISFEKLFSVSVSKVFNVLFDITKRSFTEPLKFLVTATGVLILTALFVGGATILGALIALFASFLNSSQTVSVIGNSILALSVAIPVVNGVTTAFSVLETLNVFTTAFAGVFAMIVSASGKVALGTSYASLAVLSDTLFSALLTGVSQPAVNAMCSLGFLSCFDLYKFSEKISSIVKKLYITFLGFIGTFFSGVVTLKGVMGAGVDSLTSRGIRFVVGRTVPVVGGAVSDTYSALVSSLSLIKSTVGIFGIVTVVLTVFPSLLELLGWVFALSVVISISDLLGSNDCLGMFNIFKDALTLLGATTVFSAVIFIVSVGVVIFVRGV